ncbi:aminoglycoside 3'-phosphotransferase [Bowdeniella nasicola]|nr:aminoglycoside 3'-phosphotransferase [Bowdeniella nasicola]
MSIPTDDVAAPPIVMELAGSDEVRCVWTNELGGLTFSAGERFIKWGPKNLETSMAREAERLRWAGAYVPCPEVLDTGEDWTHEWLVTRALPGRSAVDPFWIEQPEAAVRALGRSLRFLHDSLPVESCRWQWSAPARIRNARERGIEVPPDFDHAPEIDRPVVCHGDPCSPNTLLLDDGSLAGFVDFGALGVADRWADIAVGALATTWNYGPGYRELFIESYGLEPDHERLDYYESLWEAT